MGLREYQAKRDFSRTPEPRGDRPAGDAGLFFIVQKHDATRLHYDFRLALDGVLKSWAVPKGPSLDPNDKRLAVEVEDHPLDYADFEGVIPENEYGGGTVLLWDRGGWKPEGDPQKGLKKGHLRFTLEGEKLRGAWSLVRTTRNGEEKQHWLLIKHRDEAARPSSGSDILQARPESVATGRLIDQIARDRDRIWGSSPEPAEGGRKRNAPRNAKRAAVSPARLYNITNEDLKGSGARPAPWPGELKPQLATPAEAPPSGAQWLHEIKYDGYRIECELRGGRARLISRNGLDWTARLGVIARAAEQLGLPDAILDGEAVALQPDGRTSFQSLQNLLQDGRRTDLRFYVFDLLYLNGYDLRPVALRERKALLARLLGGGEQSNGKEAYPIIIYSDHFEGDGREFFEHACRFGLEGIVAKRGDRPYRSGRGGDWVKIKCSRRAEFVIGGYTEPGGSRTDFGALLVGYYEDGRLRYAGKVGTGFNRETLRAVMKKMAPLHQAASPFASTPRGLGKVHWLRPELVAEVAFGEWTEEGILRHPSFQGLREDKPAAEVRREGETKMQPPATQNASSSEPAPARKKTTRHNAKSIEVAGVQITNPDRILYPEQGVTKLELAQYYEHVAGHILPFLVDRPLTLVRCPTGRGNKCFYQRHANETTPPEVHPLPVTREAETEVYLYIDDLAGLIALTQMGVLEIHGWGARRRDLNRPDQMILDLDPGPGVPWPRVVAAARRLRAMLGELDLESFVKTTGGKGLHVVVPLVPAADWSQVKPFARAVSERLAGEDRAGFTMKMTRSRREGKIYVDYLRNDFTATAVAPYSTRAREGAPVAVPLRWDELTDDPDDVRHDLRTMRQRLSRRRKDPWAGYFEVKQKLTAAKLRAMGIK